MAERHFSHLVYHLPIGFKHILPISNIDMSPPPAKSKSTSPFIWKAHVIGHVDFDLAGRGDMSVLEIERIPPALWAKVV